MVLVIALNWLFLKEVFLLAAAVKQLRIDRRLRQTPQGVIILRECWIELSLGLYLCVQLLVLYLNVLVQRAFSPKTEKLTQERTINCCLISEI